MHCSSGHRDRKIPSAAGKVLECDSAACSMGGKRGAQKYKLQNCIQRFLFWGPGVQVPEGRRLRPVQPHSLKKTIRVLKASVTVFHNEQLCSGAMKMNDVRMLLYYRSQ